MNSYRITAKTKWVMESEQNPDVQEIKQTLIENIPNINLSDISIRVDRLKNEIGNVCLKEFQFEDFFPFVSKSEKKQYEVDGTKYLVRMSSIRYFVLRENLCCVACGIKGEKLFLEHHVHNNSPHFNVYAVENDKHVLMTKDHIYPRTHGGDNSYSNFQTMCNICNEIKGSYNLTLEAIAELRDIYNVYQNEITKKELHLILKERTHELKQPWSVNTIQNKSFQNVHPTCDLNIWKNKNGEYLGLSVYSERPEDMQQVGCIRRGETIEPLMVYAGNVMAKLSEKEVFLVSQALVAI